MLRWFGESRLPLCTGLVTTFHGNGGNRSLKAHVAHRMLSVFDPAKAEISDASHGREPQTLPNCRHKIAGSEAAM